MFINEITLSHKRENALIISTPVVTTVVAT